jgi:phosphatidylglycerophosphate synthase
VSAPVTSTVAGGVVFLAVVALIHVLLRRALARRGIGSLGPADRITLVRAWLTAVVAGLTAAAAAGQEVTGPLAVTASIALVLDLVDGWVARRTGTVTALGARFDMEVDALLVLVLSVHVGASAGWWVLGLGLARYAVLLAGLAALWLRGQVAPQYWRKVVAAVQGVALTTAASGVLVQPVTLAVLAVAAALLALSFGTEVAELWLVRDGRRHPGDVPPVGRVVGVTAALVAVWFAFAGPDRVSDLSPWSLLVLPLDAVVLLGVVAVAPARLLRWLTTTVGVGLAVVVLVRLLDLGFDWALARPFHPATEWTYAGPAAHLLADATNPVVAGLAVVGLVVIAAGALVGLPRALRVLARPVRRHRSRSLRVCAALCAAWAVAAATGWPAGPRGTVAGTGAVGAATHQVAMARTDLGEQAAFARGLTTDALHDVPGQELLRGLRGKDVLVVFVESYGRVALEGDPQVTAPVDAALTDASARLGALGWSARSGWLTSPTFGGISWLAHSTLQTGLWVDSQGRYDRLLASPRGSLSRAFGEAGWQTVADVPANTSDWPEGERFYGFDRTYDARDVGYAGPRLGYARIPDQYTLRAFADRELRPGHAPVMAEIDLVTSHVPWSPLPRLLDGDDIGDGSVYGTPRGLDEAGAGGGLHAAYGRSIAYSWRSLVSFLEAAGHDDLVLVVLGDHQPSALVSGRDAGHDVPVTVMARDPEVVARAAGWGWGAGIRPRSDAPVWRMDQFRDRFVSAYSRPSEH